MLRLSAFFLIAFYFGKLKGAIPRKGQLAPTQEEIEEFGRVSDSDAQPTIPYVPTEREYRIYSGRLENYLKERAKLLYASPAYNVNIMSVADSSEPITVHKFFIDNPREHIFTFYCRYDNILGSCEKQVMIEMQTLPSDLGTKFRFFCAFEARLHDGSKPLTPWLYREHVFCNESPKCRALALGTNPRCFLQYRYGIVDCKDKELCWRSNPHKDPKLLRPSEAGPDVMERVVVKLRVRNPLKFTDRIGLQTNKRGKYSSYLSVLQLIVNAPGFADALFDPEIEKFKKHLDLFRALKFYKKSLQDAIYTRIVVPVDEGVEASHDPYSVLLSLISSVTKEANEKGLKNPFQSFFHEVKAGASFEQIYAIQADEIESDKELDDITKRMAKNSPYKSLNSTLIVHFKKTPKKNLTVYKQENFGPLVGLKSLLYDMRAIVIRCVDIFLYHFYAGKDKWFTVFNDSVAIIDESEILKGTTRMIIYTLSVPQENEKSNPPPKNTNIRPKPAMERFSDSKSTHLSTASSYLLSQSSSNPSSYSSTSGYSSTSSYSSSYSSTATYSTTSKDSTLSSSGKTITSASSSTTDSIHEHKRRDLTNAGARGAGFATGSGLGPSTHHTWPPASTTTHSSTSSTDTRTSSSTVSGPMHTTTSTTVSNYVRPMPDFDYSKDFAKNISILESQVADGRILVHEINEETGEVTLVGVKKTAPKNPSSSTRTATSTTMSTHLSTKYTSMNTIIFYKIKVDLADGAFLTRKIESGHSVDFLLSFLKAIGKKQKHLLGLRNIKTRAIDRVIRAGTVEARKTMIIDLIFDKIYSLYCPPHLNPEADTLVTFIKPSFKPTYSAFKSGAPVIDHLDKKLTRYYTHESGGVVKEHVDKSLVAKPALVVYCIPASDTIEVVTRKIDTIELELSTIPHDECLLGVEETENSSQTDKSATTAQSTPPTTVTPKPNSESIKPLPLSQAGQRTQFLSDLERYKAIMGSRIVEQAKIREQMVLVASFFDMSYQDFIKLREEVQAQFITHYNLNISKH